MQANLIERQMRLSEIVTIQGIKFMREDSEKMSFEEILQNFIDSPKSSVVRMNHLEALKVLAKSLLLEIEVLNISTNSNKIDLAGEVRIFEINLIRFALLKNGGIQLRAAEFLNVSSSTLNAKIKRYGIATDSLYENTK